MNKYEWSKKRQLFYKEINVLVRSSHTVIIYGAGYNGIKALIELRENGLDAICFCDGSESKQGRMIGGIPVISPDKLAEYSPDTCIIISPELHTAQIKNMLEKRGLNNIIYYHDSGWVFEGLSSIRTAFPQEAGQKMMADNSAKIDCSAKPKV